MNAQEAREKAFKINTDKETGQYAEIKKIIDKEVDDGKYQCFYYKHVIPDVKKKLSEEGFSITSMSDMRNELTVTITW